MSVNNPVQVKDISHIRPYTTDLDVSSWNRHRLLVADCRTAMNETIRPVKPISTKSACHVRCSPTARTVILVDISRMQSYTAWPHNLRKFNQNRLSPSIISTFFFFYFGANLKGPCFSMFIVHKALAYDKFASTDCGYSPSRSTGGT
jgi:hypothetical protein